MSQYIVEFRSGILRLGLRPDSRGYVLFDLKKCAPEDGKPTTDLISLSGLTCEYIEDLLGVGVEAAKWITINCERILFEDRHLYFKFKQATLDAFLSVQGADVSGTLPAVLRQVSEPPVPASQQS
jgi:hypothetical protein